MHTSHVTRCDRARLVGASRRFSVRMLQGGCANAITRIGEIWRGREQSDGRSLPAFDDLAIGREGGMGVFHVISMGATKRVRVVAAGGRFFRRLRGWEGGRPLVSLRIDRTD